MTKNKFYVDSCIYINLWQKEGNKRFGKPYWKIAKEFFEKYNNNSMFYYSGFLLKELKHILIEDIYNKKRKEFHNAQNFRKLNISTRLLDQAREIEIEIDYKIGFFDIVHMLIAKKSNSILITRDKKLLEVAQEYSILAKKPEELL
jgi:predicted nucleic acid-binding protein